MQRGEKRPMPTESSNPEDSAPSPSAHTSKKAKLPDFDWSANNYELTWRLVNELVKPENRPVLFPEIEGMRSVTGETKEDVYRRIAKAVHPEAYAQDPHTAGSRMKNKNMSMWKEYSGYCRKLQDLCAAHRTSIPPTGPDPACPPVIQEEWRRIIISMPAFSKLYTFMPVRTEDKPRPSAHMKPPSLRSTPVFNLHTPMEEDHLPLDRVFENHNGSTCNSPANGRIPSPSVGSFTTVPLVNGRGHSVNGVGKPHSSHEMTLSTTMASSGQTLSPSFQNLLDLHKLYQEDCRLQIFTPHETRLRIEGLERDWTRLANSQHQRISPLIALAPPSAASFAVNNHSQINGTHSSSPSPELEQQYDEKTLMPGYRRPDLPHPLAHSSSREIYKAILDHTADCRLPECRLDNKQGKRAPRLIFTADPQRRGLVQIAIATPNGPEPLINHPPAACARIIARNTLNVMDITLVIHQSAGWETTIWDYANAVVNSASDRRLNQEEIKNIQANMQLISDANFRKNLGYLNENCSTLFDVLRTGQLLENTWEALAYTEGVAIKQH